ncbi:nucleoside hydrolase [Opitutus sp. ER46]|uniref:nucleoside hydrolase n=1 Tax=Opitutus sp. ER46 TaxID=2161864 RepID=UPI001E5B926C|nr:nucleoside hydrolase [Opitutus sp. ER46]
MSAATASAPQPYDIVTPADAERMAELTFGPRQPPVDVNMIAGAWTTIATQAGRKPAKVIIDTDIGSDIDDAIAIIFALSRPEIDVRAITTSRFEVKQRAAIVSRLLQVMGRTDVPFASGSPRMVNGATLPDKPVNQYAFAGSEADRPPPATADAQELFRRVIEADPGEVWLVLIGPMTNAALLVRDHPDLARRLKGIVVMGGEPTRAFAETNIRNDPQAAEIVCRSGWLKFVGTYDVTVRLLMPKQDMDRLRESGTAVGRALETLQTLWRVDRGMKPGPVAFDACPLLWLFAPELFHTTNQGLSVDGAAVMRVAPDAPATAVTTDIDVRNAHRVLIDTLLGARPRPN